MTEDMKESTDKPALADCLELTNRARRRRSSRTRRGAGHARGPVRRSSTASGSRPGPSHAPVFTVAKSAAVKAAIPGGHSKNLFLADRKGRLFLVTARDHARIDLKRLPGPIGAAGRLSFGWADLLRATLGVEPGSVTPFRHERPRRPRRGDPRCRPMAFGRVNVHPLVNHATTTIAGADLIPFLEATGHAPRVLTLPEPERPIRPPPWR